MFTRVVMSKAADFWGPALWRTIHSAAAAYDPTQKKDFISFAEGQLRLIPCEDCREHWQKVLDTIPVRDYIENNHSLFLWSYLAHDMVNKSIGKSSPPYENVKIEHFNALGEKCSSCENR